MKTSDQPRVTVVGSINVDLVATVPVLPRPGETMRADDLRWYAGGKGANQAVAAARLGGNVLMVGCVGDDAFGTWLRQGLREHGIDCSFVAEARGVPSGTALIHVDPSGENCITVASGANAELTPLHVEQARTAIEDAEIVLLQLEIPVETAVATIELANRCGTPVVLDPAPATENLALPWGALHVLSPNETEAVTLLGEEASPRDAAERLRELGAKNIVLKRGAHGAAVLTHDASWSELPAHAVNPVDSTAAGDAFTAALGLRLALGQDLISAARYANAAGALAVTKTGAQQAMPSAAEVEDLLGTHDAGIQNS